MDEFRKHLLDARAKELDLISARMKPGWITRDRLASAIIRSVNKVPNGADVEDSPIYQVSKWLSVNKMTHYKNKHSLAKAISTSIGLKTSTIVGVLNSYPFALPAHFEKKREEKARVVTHQFKVADPDVPALSKETVIEPPAKLADSEPLEFNLPLGIQSLTIRAQNLELVLQFR